MFEAIQTAAPKYAGRDRYDPGSIILTAFGDPINAHI